MKKRVVVKLTAYMCDNVSFVSVKDGKYSYVSQGGCSLALSNMFNDAALCGMALCDARNENEVLATVKRYATHAKKIELVSDY